MAGQAMLVPPLRVKLQELPERAELVFEPGA